MRKSANPLASPRFPERGGRRGRGARSRKPRPSRPNNLPTGVASQIPSARALAEETGPVGSLASKS